MNDKEVQYAFIHANSKQYPISRIVDITNVSRAGYYKWLNRKGGNEQDKKDEELLSYILKIFEEHKGIYGRRRIKIELENEYKLQVNEKRISRIMKKYGLQCKIRRKRFKHRPQPHGNIPNLLNRNFKAIKPGIKFAIDITYVPVKKGPQKWEYVCAIKDLYNGEIVSQAMGSSQELKLVHRALDGLKKKGYVKGAILHSDQGFQFTHHGYINRLKRMDITQSMSRRGNCWDNACIENFFGHLKNEMYQFTEPETPIEIREAVDSYIHYYNNKRVQTKLKMSPIQYRVNAA
ncbi:IS3 family transposase [Oceanobacillus senegalensis]|uniref:IS3 family transposase n=1 Tax=Oceanobacillus senegalensis TaxID=1936063 RepID=UPI000A314082|nr:IS3 family transposase [Oceanobacillus senegalensis]